MSQPGYSSPEPLSVLMEMLAASVASTFHMFLSDDISALDAQHFLHSHMHSPKQLTDLYLLALAVKNDGRLVTFDQRIPFSAVKGANDGHLVQL